MTDKLDKELEKLASDIDDITDPSSFDKVLFLYEEILNEAEEYIQQLVKSLQYRQITWEQPWYQAAGAITKLHRPFYERNDIEIATEQFRIDRMTKDEHDRISKNWKRFTKKYKVPDNLRLLVTWRSRSKRGCLEERARRFVVAYIARGLRRTLHQVFTYIQSFNLRELDFKVYNKYEQKIMEVCYLHKLEKAPPILTVVLGRHSRALYKRRLAIKKGKKIGTKERHKVKWTMERAGKLLKCLLAHTELPLEELKRRIFYKPFWLKLEEEMDTEYENLNFFWYTYLHVQLFVECDVKLYKLRRKIFKLLRDSTYQVWSDIRWDDILEHFPDGFTKQFLYKMCVSIVRKHEKYTKTPLADLANFGLQTIKSSRYTNKRLKRLTVNDEGNLQVIKCNPNEKS